MAPKLESFSKSSELCRAARVMTMRFPASGDGERSATLGLHFFEDGLRAGFDEQTSNVFAEGHGLVGRGGGALFDVLRAVHRADAGFEDKFAVLGARPGAQRYLAAALQRREQRAFGDDGGASLGVVEGSEDFGGLGVGEAALRGDGALTDGGHADVRGKGFADAVGPAEAVESGFGEHHGVVLAAFDFAQTSVDIAPQVAQIEIGTKVPELRLAAEAAGTHARAVTKMGEREALGGDQAVAHVFAAENRGKGNARRNVGGRSE